MDMTPEEFYIAQWRHTKKQEDQWEQTREIIAMIHNTAMGAKRKLKGKDIVELSKDRKSNKYEFDREFFDRAMEKLVDKRNQN